MNNKILSFIKLICIIYLIIFLPQIMWKNATNKIPYCQTKAFISSLDNLISHRSHFTNITKKASCLVIDQDQLLNNPKIIKKLTNNNLNISKILIPKPRLSKIKTINNFFEKFKIVNWDVKNNKIPKNFFDNIDQIIFNIKGLYVTNNIYFKALQKSMLFAQEYNKKIIVLDQPNLLGNSIEGPGDIPLRHGLTIGELARYINQNLMHNSVNITIIPMLNWKRNKPTKHINNNVLNYNISNIYLNHFLKTLNYIDPITIDLDRKTQYHHFYLPQKYQLSEWETEYLKKICFSLGLLCKNYTCKNNKTAYKGLKIKIKNKYTLLSAFNSLLTIARFLKNRKHIKLDYSPKFDQVLGNNKVRNYLQDNIAFEDLKNKIEKDIDSFYYKAKACFLYKPFPKKIKVQIAKC